jgi:hypothetical protein
MSILSSDLRTLSREAYVFLYPLVTMGATQRQATNVPEGTRPGFGPPNRFHHIREFPAADFRAVVRPNFDTLYSSAWLDLTRGPVRIHVPDSGDRYYMLPMLDMWTDVFANPGKRTTGTGAQDYLVTPPGYTGPGQDGAATIEAPTPHVWVIGRTQTNGPADYAAVNAFQDGWTITEVAGPGDVVVDPGADTTTEPLRIVNALGVLDYFSRGAELMLTNPPHATDHSQLARISLLGLVPGRPFDTGRFSEGEVAELEAGRQDALAALSAGPGRLATPVNGWVSLTDTMGVYGNHYVKRALVTLVGLGANPAEDAVYPLLVADSDGRPVRGETDYVLHFERDQLPPASAFWSITMYDEEGFQVANEIDRFAIGDRDALSYNDDGSLDILVQHARPDEARVSNWLPAPPGPLGITMRLYAPEAQVLDGSWNPPPLRAG